MTSVANSAALLAASGYLVLAQAALAQAITDPTKVPLPTPTPAVGAKPPSTPSPFFFTLGYTADLIDNVSGGLAAGADYVDLLKLSAAYDGATGGHDGLTGLVSVVNASGSEFTARRVGGLQAVSASETQPGALRLYEAWMQQEVARGQGAVKAGFIDINTTFDVQETAALFLDASHGIGPDLGDTGLNGPSDYPTPALAVTGVYRPAEGWTAQLGVFDGSAGDAAHRSAFVAVTLHGALVVGQVEKRFGSAARVEVGAWTYTLAFPSLDSFAASGASRVVGGNAGVYALIEGRLLPKPASDDGGLSGWVRLGRANGHINLVDNYLGAGLVYTGPIAGRDKDEAGIAIARAGLGVGARYVGSLAGKDIGAGETALEATYRYVYSDWLNIQPDLQYVVEPGGDRRTANAFVVGLRLAFTYSR